VIQLQNMMSRLQNGGTALSDETQQIMGYAQNLIRDVTAARQVAQFSVIVLLEIDWKTFD